MKKKFKTILLVISIFLILLISPLSIPFSQTISIGDLFENMNEMEIVYTDKYDAFENDGKMKYCTWDLSQYPDKENHMKELLNQYQYYNKKYKDIDDTFTINGAMLTLRLIDKDTDIILFNNTNKIIIGNSIYIISGGKKNAESLIKEIVKLMESDTNLER